MSFRVNARTVLHLGSELISSDGIAIYELIKNALDANSKVVRLDVVCRIDFATADQILRELGERRHPVEWAVPEPGPSCVDWRSLRDRALTSIDPHAPGAVELAGAIRSEESRSGFAAKIRQANYIALEDDGEGMSMETLEEVYLTIGTSYRAHQRWRQREAESGKGSSGLILGEKGLGRLSAMRLGDCMEVITGRVGDGHKSRLTIDWNRFAQAADDDIGTVSIVPEVHREKGKREQGTLVLIEALSSEWTREKLQELARDHFSKLVDPFSKKTLPLQMSFNGNEVELPTFASFILDHSHGILEANYRVSGQGAELHGTMDYRLRNRRSTFEFNTLDVTTLTDELPDTLSRVGPFTLQVYWFNRRILTGIDGIGDLTQIRRILATWAGGVSLYRDGYRVNPYGGPNDDWLDLDRAAFSTSGFKLNRGQIVGRANITQSANPYLTDQTNREGLTDGPEKRAFVRVLSAIMELYRKFVVSVDDDIRRSQRLDAGEAITRFREEDDRISELLRQVRAALSGSRSGRQVARELETSLTILREAADAVSAAAVAQSEERNRVMHLASIGLLIEVIAHELYRATTNALRTISRGQSSGSGFSASTARVLAAQLGTVQKRLKVLDPLSTNARQRKESFEIVDWVRSIVGGYAERASREDVSLCVSVEPPGTTRRVRAVKGMFVQVLENLLSNSFYWIRRKHELEPVAVAASQDTGPSGAIRVSVEPDALRIVVSDDGPGIPEERREIVFEPFFTTKRQNQGKGLGLYIAREIAEYHGGYLALGEANHDGIINSVVFVFGDTSNG